jgi:hypothetical protein
MGRANRVSRLGRLRGPQGWAKRKALGYPNRAQEQMVEHWLGQANYPVNNSVDTSNWGDPSIPSTGTIAPSSGGISPSDAAIISSAITAAGRVGTQAIIGSPSVTYNPITGTYTATGGAAIPTQAIAGTEIDSTIESFLPLLLLGGAAFLIVSLARR